MLISVLHPLRICMPENCRGRGLRARRVFTHVVVLTIAVICVSLTTSASLAVGTGAKSGQGNGTTAASGDDVKDTNGVRMGDVRRNYFKRYPFAKFSDEADQVQNSESTSGGSLNISDPAYKSVTVKCDFFSDKGSLGKKHEHYKQDQQQVSGNVAT